MTIRAIGGALIPLIKSWGNVANLYNDLVWLVSELTLLLGITQSPLVGAGLNLAKQAEADVKNLESGQAVIVGSVTIGGKTYHGAIFEEGGPAYNALFGANEQAA